MKRLDLGQRVLVLSFVVLIFVPIGYADQAYAAPSSNILAVPYHAEERHGFCGPTSIQMALEYISGNVTAQKVLAAEMNTDPNGIGTLNANMVIPFHNRGYTTVRPNSATLEILKDWNWRGYVSIIDIWWDTDRKDGHFVVVTGYNETGIIVNDPYPPPPSTRPQPHSRTTGPNAFISNQLLAVLWKSNQWALVVPYPELRTNTPTNRMECLQTTTATLSMTIKFS